MEYRQRNARPPRYAALVWCVSALLATLGIQIGQKALSQSSTGTFVEVGALGSHLAVLPDSIGKSINVWDLGSGELLRTMSGHKERVAAMVLSADETLLATAAQRSIAGQTQDTSIRLWDVNSGKEIRQFLRDPSGRDDEMKTAVDAGAQALQFSSDGRMLLSANNWGAILWDVETGRILHILGFTSQATRHSAQISRDMKTILLNVAGRITVYDSKTGIERCAIDKPEKTNLIGSISSDGQRIVTIAEGVLRKRGTIAIWSARSCSQMTSFIADTNGILNPLFLKDGESVLVASASPLGIQIVNAISGSTVKAFSPPSARTIDGYVMSSDGTRLLTHWDELKQGKVLRSTSLWDVTSGRELHRFQDDNAGVRVEGFSQDGSEILLVDGYSEEPTSLWNAKSGDILKRFTVISH
jgi:hypothetical protein